MSWSKHFHRIFDSPRVRRSARDCGLQTVSRSIAVLLLAAFLLAGCGRSQTEESAAPSSASTAPKAAPTLEVDSIAVVIRDLVQIPPSDKTEPAQINFLHHASDGTGRVFVNDMNGRIYVVKDDKLLQEPFLDMQVARKKAFTNKRPPEQGLSTFAFHPDFAKPGKPGFGKVYTSSTETPDSGIADFASPGPSVEHHNVLAEWAVDARNANRIDPASRREVLRIAHPLRDHVMGQLAFNPNAREGDADYGMLYIGVGDGGDTVPVSKKVDALRNAQDNAKLHGKILRINPLAADGRKYSIPPDNPFVRDGTALKEIWAYGLRNPQRFSWDIRGDRKMIIADIGQASVEEINIGKPGANYGWAEREGTFAVDRDDEKRVLDLPSNDALKNYTYPALQYGHDLGRAVAGGYVYRGKLLPALRGQYIFGDIVSGRIFFVDAAALTTTKPSAFRELPLQHYGREKSLLQILDGKPRADLRFGMDQDGEIYLLTKRDGMIRKMSALVPAQRKITHPGIVANPSAPR